MPICLARPARLALAMIALSVSPAISQEDMLDDMDDLTNRDAVAEAASKLVDQGKDTFLVEGMLGREIKGSDGETIGEIKDLVVIPGGRIPAALVEVDGDTTIAVPFGAVKLSGSADEAGLDLPLTKSEVEDMDELQKLAEELPSD